MNFWPFGHKLETRAESSYTDTLIAALVSRAQGKSLSIPTATAALEACAGTVGRGFAASEVSGPDSLARALTPGVLELIGRSLIRRGELVLLIDTEAGRLRLIPAETHDVEGGPYPETWEYRLTLGGPSRTVTHDFVPAASVLHFRYAVDASTPWRGNGPLAVANLAGKLSAETVSALANESSGPVGRLLGIPVDGQDATVLELKADIRDARGRTALIETGDWSGGDSKVDLKTERFGAEPPASLVQLVTIASQEVYSACGLNQALWGGSQAGGGEGGMETVPIRCPITPGASGGKRAAGQARGHRDALMA